MGLLQKLRYSKETKEMIRLAVNKKSGSQIVPPNRNCSARTTIWYNEKSDNIQANRIFALTPHFEDIPIYTNDNTQVYIDIEDYLSPVVRQLPLSNKIYYETYYESIDVYYIEVD